MERPKEHRRGKRADHLMPISESIWPKESDSRLVEAFDHSSNIAGTHKSALEDHFRVEAAGDSPNFSDSPTIENAKRRYIFGNGVFTRYNMIKLVKALVVVVLTLLVIDVILYLI
jgi:hypothetical protein